MSRRNSSRQQTQAPPPFETVKSEDYRYVYASGVYGGVDPNDSRLIFYLNRLIPESQPGQPGKMRTAKVIQELQVEVHMSPMQFKSLAQFMAGRIKLYEDKFGEIDMRPGSQDESTSSAPGIA